MSDDWGGFDTPDDLSTYLEPTVPGRSEATAPVRSAGEPTPVGPLVSPMELGNISRSSGASPPSRQGIGGLRALSLGAFTPAAMCELKSLAKLAYLFFTNVSTGDTHKALAVLGVFRFLYNDSRATIYPGFDAAIQAALPVSVPDVSWSAEMQRAIGFSLAGALGSSSPARPTLANLPGNMAAIATWFPTFRNALPAEDIATITDYANQPTSGDYASAVAAIVRDDLSSCLAPSAPAPSPPAPTPAPGATFVLSPSPPTQTANTSLAPRSSSGGSSAAVTGSGSGFLTFALLSLVGWGAWLAFKDGEESKKSKLSGAPATDGLAEKARKAAAADAPKMKCLPTALARTRVSMDELAGKRGEKLAEQLVTLPPKEALKIEEIYFSELDRIRPGAPRCM